MKRSTSGLWGWKGYRGLLTCVMCVVWSGVLSLVNVSVQASPGSVQAVGAQQSTGTAVVTPTVVGGKGGKTGGASSSVALATIGGRVWVDRNGDAVWQEGEQVLAGVTVRLYNSDGSQLFFTGLTNANGFYLFAVTVGYRYLLRLDNPVDYQGGVLSGYRSGGGGQQVLPKPENLPGVGNYPMRSIVPPAAGQSDFSAGFAFAYMYPQLRLVKTNTGGLHCVVGQQVDYVLSVSNSEDAAPLSRAYRVTLVDQLPEGLQEIRIINSEGWSVKVSSLTSPARISATYQGVYPILPGDLMAPLIISGIISSEGLPKISSQAHISFATSEGQRGESMAVNTILVGSMQDSIQQVQLSSESVQTGFEGPDGWDRDGESEPFYPELPHTGVTTP